MSVELAEPLDTIKTTSTCSNTSTEGLNTARAEASRANGMLSRGPVSLEGKARSRRNGCKDGLTGLGIVLPPDATAEVERRQADYARVLQPRNAVERELIRQIALGAWRGQELVLRIRQHEARTNSARFANWELDEQIQAAKLGRRLGEDPEAAVLRLECSSAGCDWLIGRWRLLGNGLSTAGEGEQGCTWTDADLALALNLLGRPAELRHLDDWAGRLESLRVRAHSGSDEAVAELRRIVAEEIAGLERRAEEAWEGVEQPQLQDWRSGLAFDLGPEGTRLRRYEAMAERLLRLAWNKLERLRKERGEPLIPQAGHGLAADLTALHDLPDLPAVPRPEPVPPSAPAPACPDSVIPAPVSPEPIVPAPSSPEPIAPLPMRLESLVPMPGLLDDPPAVLDLWAGGPPRIATSRGNLPQHKTNPTPGRPGPGGRADRRKNRP